MEVPEIPSGSEYDSAFEEIRKALRLGHHDRAIELARDISTRATDPFAVGRALILQVGSQFNQGHLEQCPEIIDQAFAVLDGAGYPSLLANVHSIAGIIAAPASLERCIRHLVLASRELEKVIDPTPDASGAWHDIAVTYSFVGFHEQALPAAERSWQVAQAGGLSTGDHALPEVAARWAVSLDHRGDSEACALALHDILTTWAERTPLDKLWSVERHYYGFAAARLRVMGHDVEYDPALTRTSPSANSWEMNDLRVMAGACEAITAGHPAEALELLDGHEISHYTLGAPEPHRLRALAHAAAGDFGAAIQCDREAVRLATRDLPNLRDRVADSTRTQLDHEALRRTVSQYASQALTDPLTGLPNRRHLDQQIERVSASHLSAALGIVDLDGFKLVNTRHGHLTGDIVLQRVAAILARTVRGGDFVARYGGDEFVVVLPDTDLVTARQVESRIRGAIEASDWDALVSGTPVSATMGWAVLTDVRDLSTVLEQADRDMLARKQAAHV